MLEYPSFGKGSIWEWVSNSKNVCNLAFGIGLEIIGSNVDVTGNEAILNNKNAIGYVTSGGFAHYTNKSIAFAYIFKDKNLNDIEVEINGEFYKAKIINEPLYDPQGLRIKL